MIAKLSSRTAAAVALAGALVLASESVHAADPTDDAAAAALFDQAASDMSVGRVREACAKFGDAQRLSPTAGTALNIGRCHEKLGKLASAWGAYREAEAMARATGDAAREKGAIELARAIESRVPRATIAPPLGHVAGLEVRWDGRLVGEGQWDSPRPVDAGEHTIEATAPGRQPWKSVVEVPDSPGNTDVHIPELPVAPVVPVAPPLGAPPPTALPARIAALPTALEQHTGMGGTQRILGIGLGGAGAVGLMLGSVLGVIAKAKNDDSLLNCDPSNARACTPVGTTDRNAAYANASASTAAFVAGGVLLTAGAIVYFTAPPAGLRNSQGVTTIRLRASLGAQQGTMLFGGTW
jgi:serine/threonine-protein kinase